MKINTNTTNNHFPIRKLSELTGVNSVTLRAWERRYGLLKPKRSNKGHRFYDLNDIETVKTILAWINKGVAVGKVKPLLQESVNNNDINIDKKWSQYQETFLESALEFNENKIDALYKKITKQYPLKVCSQFCFFPLFESFDTQPNIPVELHYLFNALKQRMQSTVLFMNKKLCKQPPIMLFSNASQHNWKIWLTALTFADYSLYTQVFEGAYSIKSMVEVTNKIKASAMVIYTDEKAKTLRPKDFNNLENTVYYRISGTDIWLNKENTRLSLLKEHVIYSPLETIEQIVKMRDLNHEH